MAAVIALATACGEPQEPSFNGIDLTGADWGQSLQLRDPEGNVRSLQDFRGKVVLLFFGFTQCPDVCPTEFTRAIAIKKALMEAGKEVQIVFVTLDPERDSPGILRDYAQVFDRDAVALTSDLASIRSVAAEFKVHFEKVPLGNAYTIDHAAMTFVFDKQGRVRVGFQHDLTIKACVEDVRAVLGG